MQPLRTSPIATASARGVELSEAPVRTPTLAPADAIEHSRRPVAVAPRSLPPLAAPRTPVSNPALADKDRGSPVVWRRIPPGTDLTAHGPSLHDVRQGGWDDTTRWGDCFFLAAVGAIAQRSPDFIRSMVKDNGDGTYTVKLHDQNGRPRPVRVDGTLPQARDGASLYAHSGQPNEHWVGIVEKAYASLSGGYQPIGDGADGASGAFRSLTGRRAAVYDPSTAKTDALWTALQSGERAGSPMAAGSRTDVPHDHRNAGLDEDHEYTVLGTEPDASGRYVVLRNQLELTPYTSPTYDTRAAAGRHDQGVFRVRLDDFQRWFDELSILPPLK